MLHITNLRKILCPTEEENKKVDKQIEKLKEELLVDRNKKISLVNKEDHLFCSKPFGAFIGDCESCSYYRDSNRGFITGGYCMLHNITCGYGFICKDNDSEENNGWNEFENIKEISYDILGYQNVK